MDQLLEKFSNTLRQERPGKMSIWSAFPGGKLIFDSDIHGGDSNEAFYSRILGKKELYILNFDQNGNAFGVFIKSVVNSTECWIEDKNHFLISFNSSERMTSPKRWFPKGDNTEYALYVYKDDNRLYTVGGFGYGYFTICKTNMNASYCMNLSWTYDKMEDTELTGTNHPQFFLTKRIVVLEMK